MGVTPQQSVYTHTCTLQRVHISTFGREKLHLLFLTENMRPLTERIPTVVLQLCYKTKLYECALLLFTLIIPHTPCTYSKYTGLVHIM